jgi:2-(1,2-epoxy-1,2-dihydrophenyl)acetyl-CoA isomerase
MLNPPLVLEHAGTISHLRFTRAESLNAIDSSMATAFLEACRSVADRPQTRVLVISGEGRGFMAGGNVAQFKSAPQHVAEQLIEPMHAALLLLAQLPITVLASVHGAVAGAGMSLALACDLTIAADNSRFTFAYPKLGASCDLGMSWHLPRLVGLRNALQIALLGDPLDAMQALSLGLVNQVVPLAELEQHTQALAERLASAAPIALGQLKALMRSSSESSFGEQLQAEQQAFDRCIASEDFQEGVDAFLQKRPALFKGC